MSIESCLYAVSAVLVMDNDGNLLLAKYYGSEGNKGLDKKKQTELETTVFQRTRKALSSMSLLPI